MLQTPVRLWLVLWKPLLAACVGLVAAWVLRQVEQRDAVAAVVKAPPTAPAAGVPLPPAPEPTPESTPFTVEDPATFTFVIGVAADAYLRLGDGSEVATGKFRLLDTATAVAPVRTANVPRALRAWLGKEVLVDGTCRAKVTGFAVIARVDGWPEYIDDAATKWTAASVAQAGSHVLGGRLSACKAGGWARAADRGPIAVAGQLAGDSGLEFAARSDFNATQLASEVQQAWQATGVAGDWRLEVPSVARLVREPSTGARLVLLHAVNQAACGEFAVDVLAIYRERPDGTVERVHVHHSNLNAVEDVIQVDGHLMVTGTAGLTSYPLLENASGEIELADEIPFVGCPC